MAESELKQRHTPKVNMESPGGSAEQTQARPRTIRVHEIPEWMFDNKYIVRGYRPETAEYKQVLISLTFLHNESCNVYTHLIGAVLLPLMVLTFAHQLSESQFLQVTSMDHAMFALYFICAEICLVFSVLYHLFSSHSHRMERFWYRMDLLGIVILTFGTFSSGIYYVFFCEAILQKLHWAIILSTATLTGTVIVSPALAAPRWRTVKTVIFIVFGASSFIPLLHGVQRYGIDYMLQYSGMKWYLLELSFYGAGVVLYAMRVPERFAPGLFDIWGASHQLFHTFILGAICTHVLALLQGFTTCHTKDGIFMSGVDSRGLF